MQAGPLPASTSYPIPLLSSALPSQLQLLRLCSWHKDKSYWLNVTAGRTEVEGVGAAFHPKQPPLLMN